MSTSLYKALFYLNMLVLFLVIFYKIYLYVTDVDYGAVHADQIENIESVLNGRENFSFAVVGNINNSIGVFERKIIPELNQSNVDFVVSAGNAVSSGGEDKYRALHGTLSHLQKPYLLTFGENEHNTFGSYRYYDHYGPYVFAFSGANSRFIFLDSSGKTSYRWQARWLEEELEVAPNDNVFIFVGHPLLPVTNTGIFDFDDDYLAEQSFRELISPQLNSPKVKAVFSANLPLYSEQKTNNTPFIVTGGAGGLVFSDEQSFYHFVQVRVEQNQVQIEPVKLDVGQHRFFRILESIWFFIHSLFYVGYLNYLLLVSVLVLSAFWLHSLLFEERDYYPDFNRPSEPKLKRRINVAMFTNNYLPFIGGVPISIQRLSGALRKLGHKTMIFAPKYKQEEKVGDDENIFRLPCIWKSAPGRGIVVPNLFSLTAIRKIRGFSPDVIHIHHPFWMGTLGLLAAKWLKVPVIYTYHTRLEHYSHNVPLPDALFRNFLSHLLVRRLGNKCDAVVVPSDASEHYLRMIGVKTPVFVVPTGIETDKFSRQAEQDKAALQADLGIDKDDLVLLSVSRLSEEKNIGFMLNALAGLNQTCTRKFRLILIGDGPQQEQLRQLTAELGLQDRIIFAGSVPPEKMPVYFSLGNLFVFASTSETQGMVILEAMASGMPVVAIRASGIDDFVINGKTGFKTMHNSAAWADCVKRLLEDDELRQTLSGHAESMAAGYGINQFGREMERVYAHVLIR
ncbi:glycosyltransferase [Lacimicrobium alkaliphilum]|uniref:Glycosyl transferase family 1 n=1 Tax=Lacimicrobium alkaliphilum TaxID=1526571 RepID=A0ABQ1R1N3_9ALTE|nr:glycosyltransferase [Lacimicrobium alkaliphilum]GGD55026.1 hypothetical protein GCM10011357_08450 [Lacimicrobium alkaliphilum]